MLTMFDTLTEYVVAWVWLARLLMVSGGVLMICALLSFWRMVRA
jgi:hypothetical protein